MRESVRGAWALFSLYQLQSSVNKFSVRFFCRIDHSISFWHWREAFSKESTVLAAWQTTESNEVRRSYWDSGACCPRHSLLSSLHCALKVPEANENARHSPHETNENKETATLLVGQVRTQKWKKEAFCMRFARTLHSETQQICQVFAFPNSLGVSVPTVANERWWMRRARKRTRRTLKQRARELKRLQMFRNSCHRSESTNVTVLQCSFARTMAFGTQQSLNAFEKLLDLLGGGRQPSIAKRSL